MNYTHFDQLPLILSVDELTKILGIGKNTAYDLIRCGRIRSVRIGHKIRISKEALIEFLQDNR